jgi:hypothetical protein
MKRALLLASLSLLLTFCHAAGLKGASITYNIQSYAAFQNGYSLTGTITTDGKVGSLAATDFQSWSITVTGGPNAFSASGTGIGVNGILNGLIMANANGTIIMADPGPAGLNELVLSDAAFKQVAWQEGGNGMSLSNLYSSQGLSGVWVSFPSDTALGGSPWIIAQAVPEPSSLVLVSLSVVSLGLFACARRRLRRCAA